MLFLSTLFIFSHFSPLYMCIFSDLLLIPYIIFHSAVFSSPSRLDIFTIPFPVRPVSHSPGFIPGRSSFCIAETAQNTFHHIKTVRKVTFPVTFRTVPNARFSHFSHLNRTIPAIATSMPSSFLHSKSVFSIPNIPNSSISQAAIS